MNIVKQHGDFLYVEVIDGIKIVGYLGNKQPVIIPDEINGMPVTVIGIKDGDDITLACEMIVPKNVHTIELDVFDNIKPQVQITFSKENKYYRNDIAAIYKRNEDGTEEIVKIVDKKITEFVVPDTVRVLKGHEFEGCTKLSKLVLPEGLVEFNEACVCNQRTIMKPIYIPASVKKISTPYRYHYDDWFIRYMISEKNEHYFIDDDIVYQINTDDDYTLMFGQNLNCNQVDIIEGTTKISKYAFSNEFETRCTNLSTLTIPNSVKSIGESAFANIMIKKLNLPNGLEIIGKRAFASCNKLESVVIPESVEYIDITAFSDCENLIKFEVAENNPFFMSENGILYSKDKTRLINYPCAKPDTEFVVPDGVIDICEAFRCNKNINSLTLPSSIESIGENAFYNTKIKDIFFKGDIKKIDKCAFGYRDEVHKLHVSSQSAIARYVEELIKNGENILTIVDDFDSLEIQELKKQYEFSKVKDGLAIIACKENKKIIELPSKVGDIPVVEVDSINREWNGNDVIEEIIIPEGIKRLNAGSLNELKRLRKIFFPKSLEFIDKNIFATKKGEYKDLYMNRGTIFIVKRDSIAESFLLKYHPKDLLNRDTLAVVYEDEYSEERIGTIVPFDFKEMDNGEIKASSIASYNYEYIEKIIVPQYYQGKLVTSLDISGWGIKDSVKELYISKFVKEIKCSSYEFTKGLKKLFIDSENEYFTTDGIALFNKNGTILYRIFNFDIEKYIVPDGVEIIEKEAFRDCKTLLKVTLPKTIKEIGMNAFEYCWNLNSVIGLDKVKTLGDKAFFNTHFEQNVKELIVGTRIVKYKNTDIVSYVIPDGIEEIGDKAFYLYNTENNLEEVLFPTTLKKIGSCAFSGRNKLKKVIIPEGVTILEDRCFEDCSSLEEVILPDSLIKIGDCAFDGCMKLKTINIPKGVQEIGTNVFPLHKEAENYLKQVPPEEVCEFVGVSVDSENVNFASVNGALYSKDGSIIYYVPDNLNETCYIISNSVKEIKTNAFYLNRKIEKIVFEGTILEMGIYPFNKMEVLKSVKFSDEQKEIPNQVFSECFELREVILPSGLEKIGKRAFFNCGITKISLPNTLKEICDEAFADNKISKVVIPKSVEKIGKNIFCGHLEEVTLYDNIESNGEKVGLEFFAQSDFVYIDSAIGLIGAQEVVYGSMGEDNSRWMPFTVIVKSTETNEVKFKVQMPGKSEKIDRTNLELAMMWDKNAQFNFEKMDVDFEKFKKFDKVQYVVNRLYNIDELDEVTSERFIKYLNKNAKMFVKKCIEQKRMEELVFCEQFEILKKSNIDDLIKFAQEIKAKKFVLYLEEYKEKNIIKKKK